jgi:hypothetical protein
LTNEYAVLAGGRLDHLAHLRSQAIQGPEQGEVVMSDEAKVVIVLVICWAAVMVALAIFE